VRTIRPREVVELLDKIVARGSRVMANRTAATLGQMFNYGIQRGLIEDTPVRLLMRPGGKERPRSRALTKEELRIFLANPLACTRQPRLAHVVELLLLTAARRGELTAAKWSQLDLVAGVWTIPPENSKTEKQHELPLSDRAVELFEKLKKRATGSVWVLSGADPKQHLEPRLLTRGLAKCLPRFRKAGIAAFTLHDLRRTCRTGLGTLGVKPHIAELVLNHAQGGIIGTYDVGSYQEEMRAALECWAAHLQELAGAGAQTHRAT
jgi:integrase